LARPKHEHPTPAELEVLQVLWEQGPMTVRQVMAALGQGGQKARAYTSVMSLMSVMADKGLLSRQTQGKAFVYSARAARQETLGGMVGDLLRRAFEGSAAQLVAHLLPNADEQELEQIRRTIESYRRGKGGA
jgi:BlaI family transcriptional regulator, penicillinase repressor